MLNRMNDVDAALKETAVLQPLVASARVELAPGLNEGDRRPAPRVTAPPLGVECVLLASKFHVMNPFATEQTVVLRILFSPFVPTGLVMFDTVSLKVLLFECHVDADVTEGWISDSFSSIKLKLETIASKHKVHTIMAIFIFV